jgi:hypothetical protein
MLIKISYIPKKIEQTKKFIKSHKSWTLSLKKKKIYKKAIKSNLGSKCMFHPKCRNCVEIIDLGQNFGRHGIEGLHG